MNYLQETVEGTKLLDRIFKKLKGDLKRNFLSMQMNSTVER